MKTSSKSFLDRMRTPLNKKNNNNKNNNMRCDQINDQISITKKIGELHLFISEIMLFRYLYCIQYR